MKTRTIQIELSPGSTTITECDNCGQDTLITAEPSTQHPAHG